MPDLLLELFCEEIPARMQATAADNLRKLVTDALVERGLVYEGAKAFVTPRRLALAVHGLPAGQPDTHEERKGPRVGAPEAAIQGFLKAAGLASLDEATIESDPKKGEFYVARIHKHGRPTPAVIADIVPEIVRTFPWPKSMRWGEASAKPGSLRWVRPLQSILCTFGPETEEPEVVRFEIDGLKSGDVTRGHRFLSEGEIKVRRLDDWMVKLEAAHVVVDRERRKDIILNDAKDLALAQGLELVEDAGLLEEIAGLVEWPVVLLGEFEERFLDIPDEVIRATIRANQKCFVLKDPKTGRLANRFVLVSNLVASDGGTAIVAGNGRVIRARLSGRQVLLGHRSEEHAGKPAAEIREHHLPREAGLAGGADRAHRQAGPRTGARRRCRSGSRREGRPPRQGGPADRGGRRVPRGAGPDGQILRPARRPARGDRGGFRGALQAAGAERPRADRAGLGGGGAGRQDRHAGRLLGHRREADRQQGPLCAAPRGAGRGADRAGERAAAVCFTRRVRCVKLRISV